MIRSMTGYGAASLEFEEGSVTVEARSVNSRHLKVSVRGLEVASAWEPRLRAAVGDFVQRGRVDVTIAVSGGTAGPDAVQLDEAKVQGYLRAFEVLRDKYHLPGQPDIGLLIQTGGLLREADEEGRLGWLEADQVERVLRDALGGLVEMREREGRHLEEDLRGHVARLREGLAEVRRLAPERLRSERVRLRKAVAELAEGVELDEERLDREIALIADKWDISEEIVRSEAHLEAFDGYLDAPAEEAVGKRLGFLVQELQREVNTLGAKANDARISRLIVEMKNAIEGMREQVENVE